MNQPSDELPDALRSWWSFVKAGQELDGEPIKDDDIILNYSGNGASIMVTAKDIDNHFARTITPEELKRLHQIALENTRNSADEHEYFTGARDKEYEEQLAFIKAIQERLK